MKKRLFILSILFLFGLVSFANAQVGFTAGTEYGIGVIAQFGSHALKFEVGAGMTPLFVFWQVEYDGSHFKLYFPGTVGAKLNFSTSKIEDENRLGIKFGVSYNTIMKMGFGGGIDYTFRTKPTKIIFSAGVMYYPKAYDELLERLNESEGTNYHEEAVSAVIMNIQPFLSISFLF